MTAPKFAPGGIRYCFDPTADTTPMPNRSVGLAGLLKLTAAVAEAGCVLPPAFIELRDRFQAFSTAAAGHAPTMLDRLNDALITGHGDPHLWFACAMAETGAGHIERRAEVLSQVHAAMEHTLRDLYAPVASAHYRTLAQRFDKAADGFMRCAQVVDPGADAAQVVNAGDRTVKAWRDALGFANELDALIAPLTAAAELVRPVTSPTGLGVSRDVFTLPLIADIGDIHKRIAWHAWMDWPEPRPVNTALSLEAIQAAPTDQPVGTRCGHWTRLWRIDADIRAHNDPAQLVLFGQPKPYAIRDQQPARNDPRHGVVERFDPEGTLPEPRRSLWDRLTGRRTDEPEPEPNIHDTVL